MRPVLRQVVAEVVASEAFKGLFHAGVREMHAGRRGGPPRRLRVQVDDAGQLVKDALPVVNPGMANAIPDTALDVSVGMSQSRWADLFMRGADLAGWLILPSTLAAVACFTAAARRARDRRRALEVVGACLVAVGVVIFAVLAALLNVAADVGQDPRQRTALRAVFWSAVHVLNVTGKVLIVLGAVIALAASAGRRQLAPAAVAELEPHGPGHAGRPRMQGRRGRSRPSWLGMVGLVWPLAMAELVVRGAAVGLIVVGAVWVFDLVGASSWVSERERAAPARVTPRRLALGGTTGVATFSLVLLLGGMSFVRAVRAPASTAMSIKDSGCNGYAALCDRRVDEVTFAGTHNSMSASAGRLLLRPPERRARRTADAAASVPSCSTCTTASHIKDVVRTDVPLRADAGLSDAQLTPEEEQGRRSSRPSPSSGPRSTRRTARCTCATSTASSAPRWPRTRSSSLHDCLRVNPQRGGDPRARGPRGGRGRGQGAARRAVWPTGPTPGCPARRRRRCAR